MIDPICGMTVEPDNAAGKHVYNGQTYYFCSQHCLAKFKEDPEKFLKSRTDEQHHARVHPESRHPRPDPSTSSGQALPPSRGKEKTERSGIKGLHVEREAQVVAYVCPMDSEVRESKPGALPQVRHGFGTRGPVRPNHKDRVRLPHASRNRAFGAGFLSDMRHGARASHSYFRRRSQPRAYRHDTSVLGWRGLERADRFFSPCPT